MSIENKGESLAAHDILIGISEISIIKIRHKHYIMQSDILKIIFLTLAGVFQFSFYGFSKFFFFFSLFYSLLLKIKVQNNKR